MLVLAGCTFGGPQASGSGRPSDVVEEDEIAESTTTNAYELVERIRPNWLRGRGSPDLRGSPEPLPVIYIEGARQGGVNVLRSIPTASLVRLRFIDAPTATTRYGSGHSGGVILVTLRSR
jgi:hypothetical protein